MKVACGGLELTPRSLGLDLLFIAGEGAALWLAPLSL